MIISWNGEENFVIKTKNKTVKIGKDIFLGDLKIITPGEYEAGGVQVEAVDGVIEIMSEKITVAWMKRGKIFTDEELEKLDGINVLLIGVGSGDFTDTKTAIDVINQLEPAVVIPMYKSGIEEFLKEEGVTPEPMDQFKFSYNDLSAEERKVIVLNQS